MGFPDSRVILRGKDFEADFDDVVVALAGVAMA